MCVSTKCGVHKAWTCVFVSTRTEGRDGVQEDKEKEDDKKDD